MTIDMHMILYFLSGRQRCEILTRSRVRMHMRLGIWMWRNASARDRELIWHGMNGLRRRRGCFEVICCSTNLYVRAARRLSCARNAFFFRSSRLSLPVETNYVFDAWVLHQRNFVFGFFFCFILHSKVTNSLEHCDIDRHPVVVFILEREFLWFLFSS